MVFSLPRSELMSSRDYGSCFGCAAVSRARLPPSASSSRCRSVDPSRMLHPSPFHCLSLAQGEKMRMRPFQLIVVALFAAFLPFAAPANAATVVALGASNTYGKGVAPDQSYPAQLEAILRARGLSVTVVNAGINGDTTEGMLNRLDSAVPNGTRVVILQPGGNDRRKGRTDRTAEIQNSLRARGIRVIMLGNNMLRGLPHQPDGMHLTPDGYRMLAQSLAPQVAGAIGH